MAVGVLCKQAPPTEDRVKTVVCTRPSVSKRLTGDPACLLATAGAVLIFGAALSAQPIAASITTSNQPAFGQATFDGSGNVYYLNSGPVTPEPRRLSPAAARAL
jgi:hypothetical protein